MEQPRIAKSINNVVVRQKQPFNVRLNQFFTGQGNIQYRLVGNVPHWISLGSSGRTLTGVSPMVARRQDFYLTIEAYNEAGATRQNVIVSVVTEEFLESLNRALLELSLRKRYVLTDMGIPKNHELLEFLYEFLLDADKDGNFFEMIEEKAKELDIELKSDPASYEEFKQIVERLNPDIETQLVEDFGEKHFLAQLELDNIELRNAVRQGGQKEGVVPIVVWNYLAAADQHVWSAVHNVLDSAAERIIEGRTMAKEAATEQAFEQKNNPPKLGSGPKMGR